jgi:ATP-dependent helicase/nuclease subunit A
LYVAMTRAAERLIVCGTQGRTKIPDGCWYQLVSDSLEAHCTSEPADDGDGEVLRYRKLAEAPSPPKKAVEKPPAPAITPPLWLTQEAAREVPAIRTVTPSSAEEDEGRRPPSGGAKAALERGRLTHRLMQALPDIPQERRAKAIEDYLSRAGDKLDAAERTALAGQVMRVLGDPRFQALYAPGSRAEVPIVGKLKIGAETVRVSGQIDRLAVTQDAVFIADFKTNRPAPQRIEDVPLTYVRQLALYRAVLARLYPEKVVRAALVWTEVPDLMELSAEVLEGALAQVKVA